MAIIKLQTTDGKIFETDVEIVKCSSTIKNMVENCDMDEGEQDAIVPLKDINSAILHLVLQWANQHKDDPIPEDNDDKKEKKTDDIPEWDADFLKIDQSLLFEMIQAAMYLDIKGLLTSCCKTVANMMKGKSPEEIRATFDIPSDFSPEEEEQARKEVEWCQEK